MKRLRIPPTTRFAQRGVAAVEFALVAIVFLTVVFGTLELARIVYMFNTLADVTRSAARSAANIDWRDTTALDRARQRALYRDSPGTLPFGAPISDRHIRIDYMYLRQVTGSITMESADGVMPASPGRNRHNCQTIPYGTGTSGNDTCIRVVRVRICAPDSAECENVRYQPLFSLLPLNVPLPISTTMVNAETLGYRPGDALNL